MEPIVKRVRSEGVKSTLITALPDFTILDAWRGAGAVIGDRRGFSRAGPGRRKSRAGAADRARRRTASSLNNCEPTPADALRLELTMSGALHGPDGKPNAPAMGGNGPMLATLAVILLFKLALLLVYGPIVMPDTGDYLTYAKTILRSTDWLHDANLAGSPLPLAYRMIGFPAILAASLTIGGSAWPYVMHRHAVCTVAVRLLDDLPIGAWTRTDVQSGDRRRDRLCDVGPAHPRSEPFDDSIHASLVIIAVCLLSKNIGSRLPMRPAHAALAGALLALAFLLRDAMQFLFVVFLPVLAARMLATRGGAIRSLATCLALLLPLLATVEAYKSWNYYRSGERFVAPIGQLTILDFFTRAAQFDPDVLGGDTTLEIVARRQVRDRDPKVLNIAYGVSYELFDRGYRATDVAKTSYALYFKNWRERPSAMFKVIRAHVSERLLKLAFRPLTSVCQTVEWATMVKQCPDERVLMRAALSGFAGESLATPALFVLGSCERIISIGVSLAFILGAPLMLVFGLRRLGLAVDPSVLLSPRSGRWLSGWTAAYAAVVMEERYLAPIVPFVIVSGLAVIQRMIPSFRQTRLRAAWRRTHQPVQQSEAVCRGDNVASGSKMWVVRTTESGRRLAFSLARQAYAPTMAMPNVLSDPKKVMAMMVAAYPARRFPPAVADRRQTRRIPRRKPGRRFHKARAGEWADRWMQTRCPTDTWISSGPSRRSCRRRGPVANTAPPAGESRPNTGARQASYATLRAEAARRAPVCCNRKYRLRPAGFPGLRKPGIAARIYWPECGRPPGRCVPPACRRRRPRHSGQAGRGNPRAIRAAPASRRRWLRT